jgi:hypothetical protein
MATVTATNIATTAERGRRTRAAAPRRRTAARAAIALGALAAGALILPGSLASALSDGHPAFAAWIAPWNARAAASAAAALGADPRTPESRALVSKALARDLTVLPALELRALDLAASGKRADAARLFGLSDRLSRRSLPTRLWLIQSSVDRGDVAGALGNFDIALRTSTGAPPILFPVLAKAAGDPSLTAPLARLLDQPSDWRLMFFEWALANDANLHSIANVAARMRDRRLITHNQVDQRMIEQLVTAGDFGQALRLRLRFDPKPLAIVADPRFSDPSAQYPFGWGLVSDGSMGAERTLDGTGSALTYRATSSRSGQVAAQLLVLRPGHYAFATRAAAAASGEAPYWSLTCGQAGGEQLATLDQPLAPGPAAATEFTVPGGCTAQWLTLRLRPSGEATPQSGSIAWVSVTRR